ncbi:hypothetical protein METSCH_E03530 [Metschnikowia aff. pulcherrima]|uniref:Uncharacterized protein n=1 Tax=Metschnikowia aff. pulcherrima TaxID=2163413 RepID=A0A4V1AER3_9ASCO|nr:hypothetical protein METSCH_E03530 [Metschnikowia aff. pulcherrima]
MFRIPDITKALKINPDHELFELYSFRIHAASKPIFILHINLRFDEFQIFYQSTHQCIVSRSTSAVYCGFTDDNSGLYSNKQHININLDKTNALSDTTKTVIERQRIGRDFVWISSVDDARKYNKDTPYGFLTMKRQVHRLSSLLETGKLSTDKYGKNKHLLGFLNTV